MKASHALIAAAGFVGISAGSLCLAGNRPQPAVPPIPPSWKQPPQQPQQQPTQQPAPNTSNTDPNSTNTTDKNGKKDSSRHQDRRNMNQYPYGYPGYGQPTAGVYYPGSGVSSTAGNPNAVNPNNANPNANNNGQGLFNNAPVPDNKPAPTIVTPTPPTPPDPELIQASADVNSAMDHLREELLKTNADYQAAVADKKAAQEASAVVHAKDDSTPDQILAAATRVLEASKRVVQIERDAAVTDPQVQDAQSKLKTAMAAHAANAAATAAAK